jgi:hypothetical protein
MNVWVVDIFGFLVLCTGTQLGQPRLLRALASLGAIYFLLFLVLCFLWLRLKFADFTAHPGVLHVGIEAAFGFEGFWRLLGNLLLLYGLVPIALAFLLFFSIRWLAVSSYQRKRSF